LCLLTLQETTDAPLSDAAAADAAGGGDEIDADLASDPQPSRQQRDVNTVLVRPLLCNRRRSVY